MNRASTTAELAAVDYDPFADASLARVAPTTESQREIWLASGLSREASLAYNESVSLRLRGPLDLEALRAAVRQLVARHEALRATISADGQELCIVDALEIEVPLIDAGGALPASHETAETALHDVLQRAVNAPFDLERGPLVRAEVVRLSGTDHVVVLTAHHIVCDGWSFAVLAKDLGRSYAKHTGVAAVDIAAAASFADYAVAENERTATVEHAADERHWLGVFDGTIPTLDLPTDRPRQAHRTFASRREDRVLAPELVAQARKLGGRQGASLFSTLLGAFAATVSRLAGSGDVVIGVPSAGQSIGDHGELVGHCVNLLPIRIVSAPADSLLRTISATQHTMFDAFEHGRYTFGTLLKKLAIQRDPSRLPLVSVMFNLDQQLEAAQLPFAGLGVEFTGNPRSFENFELFINAVQVGGALRLECQYNADLFDAGTIERWLACYETLLRAACEAPEKPLGELDWISDADRRLLATWNDTRAEFQRDALVHTLFEAQAHREPGRLALRCGDVDRSYGELDAQANRIAHALRGMGVRRGALVGLHVERNADLLAAMLGVLKAGGAYVPLDPAYPVERLNYMVTDAGLTALVTQAPLAAALGWPRDRSLLLDEDAAALLELPTTAPPAATTTEADAEQPAYVIYTSGSTGKPKGVRVPHRAVVNFLESMQREPGLTAEDRLVAVTTLSFDIAVTELLLPLTVGAQIVLASRDEAVDGALLAGLIARSGATVMQATPATWRLLVEAGWRGSPSFKALCGGEALAPDLAQTLAARTGALWNMYGPTETTVWSTCCRIDAGASEAIAIGRPFANTVVRILDERLQLCPIGIPGEIFIGGDGLTSGYHHRPELTAERFVADPFATLPDARLYRTGDRGRWRADGLLEHLGRNDFQVKVRGYRIEPGEIEAGLQTHPQVARAVVVALEVQPGDVRLVAYVVARAAGRATDTALHAHLKITLPEYMVPQHFVWLASIPLLPNGKVDRRALPPVAAVDHRAASETAFVAPVSELEQQVVGAMEGVLTLTGLGMQDDFFRLGGHSLLAAKLIARLNTALQVCLPMRTAFECPTAAQLVDAVRRAMGEAPGKVPAPIARQADQTRGPLTLSQQRMRFVEELHPGRVAYNTPSAHRLTGPMQPEAFDRAFAEVVARQPALRTVIVANGAEYEQRVCESVAVSLLPVADLSSMPEAELMRRLDALIAKPFDLARPPLFVAELFKLGDNEHVFFFMAHHIVWDGWSFDLLYEEIASAYEARVCAKTNTRAAPALSCIDYAHWQNRWLGSDDCRSQVAHWQAHFAGATAAREIRSDFARKPGMSGRGSTEWVHVPHALTEQLRAIAQEAGATLNMLSLAAYAAMLHATAQCDELTLGIPVRGRAAPGLEPVMGFFNNLLPLRVRADTSRSFVDWVRDVKQLMLGAMDHQDVPFEKLVQEVDSLRTAGNTGYYQALFSFQDARERTRRWAGLEQQGILVFQPGATEDLGLWLMEVPTGLEGGVTYNADLFRRETAQLLRDRYLHLLERIARQPGRSLSALLDIGDEETNALEAGLAEAVSQDIAVRPADASRPRPAFQWGEQQWSVGELWQRVDAIGAALRRLGPQVVRVGVQTENPLSQTAAWLAIAQAGMTCVVSAALDAGGDAGSTRAVDAWVGDASARDLRVPFVDIASTSAAAPLATVAPVSTVLEIVAAAGLTRVARTTLGALAQALADRLLLNAGDCCLIAQGMPEATRFVEVLATLAREATVVFVSDAVAADGDQMAALIKQTKARAAHLTPSAFRGLLDAWWTSPDRFAAVVDGVEASAGLSTALRGAGCEVWSLHRSALSGVPVALDRVTADEAPMHMGRPLLRGVLSVRGRDGRTLPVGSVGRLQVSLSGAEGMTRQAAGAESNAASTEERACIGADGRLVVFADADTAAGGTTCLDGHWLDLSALEQRLKADGTVAECIAVVHEERPGDRRLHLYVVPPANEVFDEGRAQARVAGMLPPAVRAAVFTSLSAVSRLADGRPDRAALAARVAGGAAESPRPSTPTELALAAVWSELLGVSQVELGDNFFDLGGSSLLAMQASERLAASIGKRLAPRRYLFETLGQLALACDADDAAPGEPVAANPPGQGGLFGRLRGLMRRSGT
jgi:amino acid adenylation domain-containing protein